MPTGLSDWTDRLLGCDSRGGDTRLQLPDRSVMRALRWLLWGLVALGAIGGLAGLVVATASSSQTAGAAANAASAPEPPAGLAGLAELEVAAFFEESGEQAADRPGERAIRAATVGIDQLGPHHWAVTVAVELAGGEDADEDASRLRRWFSLGIARSGVGLVATSPPAEIAAPPAAEPPPMAVDHLQAPTGELTLVAEAVEGFLEALLAGSGELERYLAPGVELHPVVPAPYAAVSVERLGVRPYVDADNRWLVVAETAATEATGVVRELTYGLVVVRREGRLEVAELLPAPPLEPTASEPARGDRPA